MKFNLLLLVALGAFAAGSAAGFDPTQIAPGPLGPGGSGRSPSVASGAQGPAGPAPANPSLTAPGPLGPGGSGSSRNIQALKAFSAQGPASSNRNTFDPTQNAPGPAGPGGSGTSSSVAAAYGPAPRNPSKKSPGSAGPGGSGTSASVLAARNTGAFGPESTGPVIINPPANSPGGPDRPRCGKNEVYQTCGVGWQCENYCGRGANACAYCEDGCYCKKGYIRDGPEYTAKCIPENSCPRARDPPMVENSGPVCGRNEVYQTCGVGWQCEDYCGRGANACAYCEDGCYCKKGYTRSGPEYTAKCIPKNQCPRARDPPIVENSGPRNQDVVVYEETVEIQCNVNEYYSFCGGCDQFCDSGPIACSQGCDRPGCYCREGYVRSFDGGVCIPDDTCPRNQPDQNPGVQCGANEYYSDCGGCDQFCDSGPIACAQGCDRPGCYCREGYVRSFDGGVCIPDNACPRSQPDPNPGVQCNVNEYYSDCGGCDQFCDSGPIACSQGCNRPGCYCKVGYKRSFDGGICIPDNTCPGSQPDQSPGFELPQRKQKKKCSSVKEMAWNIYRRGGCPKNEYYSDCGACDQICNSEPIACSQGCDRSGCYCRKGYKRSYKGGNCIPENACPVLIPLGPGPVISPGARCGANEVFKDCGVGSQCQDYCGRGANACAYCEPGCYCKKGYIRDGPESSAKCIHKNKCPRAQNGVAAISRPACPVYEEYRTCGVGSQCEDYCGRGANACAYCEDGCYCKKGYIRINSRPKSACVKKNQCAVAGK